MRAKTFQSNSKILKAWLCCVLFISAIHLFEVPIWCLNLLICFQIVGQRTFDDFVDRYLFDDGFPFFLVLYEFTWGSLCHKPNIGTQNLRSIADISRTKYVLRSTSIILCQSSTCFEVSCFPFSELNVNASSRKTSSCRFFRDQMPEDWKPNGWLLSLFTPLMVDYYPCLLP